VSVLERLTDRIEGAAGLDALAKPAVAFWGRLLSPGWLTSLASGTPLRHPAHPAAATFTAGSLLSASVLDATGDPRMRPAAQALIGAGVVGALPTVVAGWSDWLYTEQAEKRVGLVHAATNATGLTAYGLSLLQRRRGGDGRAAGFVGAAVLAAGGWLGGHLAYAQGVGVDTNAFQTGPADWTDVAATGDVTVALTRVEVDGVALLLTRVAGTAVALADRCGHRGAPLSDGDRAGDCVICPWHDARYDLVTGDVRRGPAVRPQPTYQVREAADRIQVRRVEERALRVNPA
jgi:nitrite reductase/ring-hydroxylating ferredoxin subunit/uncharacterized membrane protein